jgi:O-antigen ligase
MNRPLLFDRWRTAGAFFIGFTIPISTTISEIVTVIAFLVLLLDWQPKENWERLRANPVFWASFGLFALLTIAMFYSVVPLPEAVRTWVKYRDLVYLPLFMLLCRDTLAARAGLLGFLSALGVMMTLGFGEWFVAHALGGHMHGNGSVFGSYITEGVMESLAAYYFAVEAIRNPRWRNYAAIAAGLAAAFVLFINPGRTGFVVLIALSLLLLFQTAPRKLWLPGVLLVALAAASIFVLAPELRGRIMGIAASINGHPFDSASFSASARMHYDRGCLLAIAQHPIFGTGTGSFNRVYGAIAMANNLGGTTNPHNEYLLIGVQAGVVGMAAFLALLGSLWFHAARLPEADAWRGRGLAVAFAVGCLFNSMLLDHVDGQSFAFQAGLFFFGARDREDKRRHHDV